MRYTVKMSGKFKKSYKLAQKRGLNVNLLKDITMKLGKGIPLDEKYKDHALKGKWEGFRECHIQPDWLLTQLSHPLNRRRSLNFQANLYNKLEL